MVRVREKRVREITYYYLEHSLRDGSKVRKREKYLGRSIPKDIERIKRRLLYEINKQKWFNLFDKIKERSASESKATPESAREKEIRSFSIRFTYDTQRIEGSALSLRETARLLEKGVTPRERPIEDVNEAETHRKVFFDMLNYQRGLTLQAILYWHKRLFEQTKPDIAGQIRKHHVTISGSKFVPPTPVEVYPMLTGFFKWYNRNKGVMHPVELVALVHFKFVTIHPFSDGNGRLSRLMINFVLKKLGYPMLNIQYIKRNSYYNALERSQIKGDETIFAKWFFKRYLQEYERYAK